MSTKKLLRRPRMYLLLIVLLVVAIFVINRLKDDGPHWTTEKVSHGEVSSIISVSGAIDAVGTAELAFPTSGIVESISVREGDSVTKGQVLITLIHNNLKADYQDALGALVIAEADYNELINGLRSEERDISKTTVEIARENLVRVTTEQNTLVENAYRSLLSDNLVAKPVKATNEDTPPSITGVYTCGEGEYSFDTYPSKAKSGLSYRFSGIEEGSEPAYTASAVPFGRCGLSIQFVEGVHYGNSIWTITIPNTESDTYVDNLNAYNLALTKQKNAIASAEQDLVLAEQNKTLDIATPRGEALARAEARVMQAKARVEVISAQIADHILVAPFDGVITRVGPVVGETPSEGPVVTMVSEDAFELTALLPEIDVTKVRSGQKAEIIFDAQQSETLIATITFISPLAKEVDGVSYFEAKLVLDDHVEWIKSGLNADIDIIIEKHENVTRLPKRYVTEKDGAHIVLIPNGKNTIEQAVTVSFEGNDGFVEISGLSVDDVVIAP